MSNKDTNKKDNYLKNKYLLRMNKALLRAFAL